MCIQIAHTIDWPASNKEQARTRSARACQIRTFVIASPYSAGSIAGFFTGTSSANRGITSFANSSADSSQT